MGEGGGMVDGTARAGGVGRGVVAGLGAGDGAGEGAGEADSATGEQDIRKGTGTCTGTGTA